MPRFVPNASRRTRTNARYFPTRIAAADSTTAIICRSGPPRPATSRIAPATSTPTPQATTPSSRSVQSAMRPQATAPAIAASKPARAPSATEPPPDESGAAARWSVQVVEGLLDANGHTVFRADAATRAPRRTILRHSSRAPWRGSGPAGSARTRRRVAPRRGRARSSSTSARRSAPCAMPRPDRDRRTAGRRARPSRGTRVAACSAGTRRPLEVGGEALALDRAFRERTRQAPRDRIDDAPSPAALRRRARTARPRSRRCRDARRCARRTPRSERRAARARRALRAPPRGPGRAAGPVASAPRPAQGRRSP